MQKEYDFSFFTKKKSSKKSIGQYLWDCDFLKRKKDEQKEIAAGMENLFTCPAPEKKTGWNRLKNLDVYMFRSIIVAHLVQGIFIAICLCWIGGAYLANKLVDKVTTVNPITKVEPVKTSTTSAASPTNKYAGGVIIHNGQEYKLTE